MQCTVIVELVPKPGEEETVWACVENEIDEIREAHGCLRYDMFRRVDGATVLIEDWVDREAWQAHFTTPAIARLKDALTPLLAKPAERWETYPA